MLEDGSFCGIEKLFTNEKNVDGIFTAWYLRKTLNEVVGGSSLLFESSL